MIELSPLEIIIARLLATSAINKTFILYYSEITEYIQSNHGLNVNPHFGLSTPLGNISALCNELHLPLLSVCVQYKNTRSITKVAQGFYDIARKLKPEYSDMTPHDVWKKEVALTKKCTEWQRLVDYLDRKQYLKRQAIYPDDFPDDSIEYREGRKKAVNVNIYERNPRAKQLCIKHYGAVCCICGFDFGQNYGEEFTGMIHIHHLKMISEYDDEYVIDPVADLRPVCPNCHMVIHSKQGGYSIDEVSKML